MYTYEHMIHTYIYIYTYTHCIHIVDGLVPSHLVEGNVDTLTPSPIKEGIYCLT